MTNILITTTPTVENRPVREYLGIVSGEAFMRRWWLSDSVLEYATEKLDNFDWLPIEKEALYIGNEKIIGSGSGLRLGGLQGGASQGTGLGDSPDGKSSRGIRGKCRDWGED
jgi:hypothetical protein